MNKKYRKIWQVLHSYEGEILGYLKRAVEDGEVARDLFQEVYYQALVNLDRLNPDRSLKNWLYTVARNKVINYYRDQNRRAAQPLEAHHQTLDAPHAKTDDEAIQFALQALPERQRKIFLLREIEELDYRQLASEFRLSEAAVTSLLSRARNNFKKQYQLFFLPDWLKRAARQLPLEDVLRFVKPEVTDQPILRNIFEQSQRYFSNIRQQWDLVREQFFTLDHLHQIFSELPELENKTVLDAGSATGMVAINCALKARQVIAVDINRRFVRYLRHIQRTLGLQNLWVVRADLRTIPLRPQSVDLIFATLVLHHLPHPPGWFETAAMLLKAKGHLVIVDFERHNNRQLADTMHDIWLGFAPAAVERWAKDNQMKLAASQQWHSRAGLAVRRYLFEKR
ncbi:RNA polymerase, sigma-24 subunit, ECF subfamily [Caldithrix abyssi DSM 13497]|uniref:RNA polymerase sigma factor, sigma-70 family n=1 Tax=Caldithrix abyssi DSM 13497 TaxID=880073 RepID=H1XT90_CALAY|nr:sigma-70 family RNA polymerase sigma factor [Caldithrix abyssi]APF18673.1 RNA polymerase sigma factor, sigma-70 family [Caldithrix abyssi DSM 13497]EHO42657.1 RNA polymerase, sigma-24 subunit, ECF subfamily [Caldithrix abyssi DSM 13497]